MKRRKPGQNSSLTPFSGILSAAAVLRGGLCPAERLVKSFRWVYKGTQDAEVKPNDCRDAPHGNILGKARAV